MLFKKALRLLLESQLIAQLIRKNYGQLSNSGCKEYDDLMTKICKENADFDSFIFVSILFIIFAKKGFGEWTDFWYDMGARIYANDAYDPDEEDLNYKRHRCDDDDE